MKRVIDIPESKYLSLKKCFENDVPLGKTDAAILKSIPLNDVLDKIKAEIKEWYWQADKQALAKDPCVVDAMIDLFIRTIDKYKAESKGE